jgi:hypothetical protein
MFVTLLSFLYGAKFHSALILFGLVSESTENTVRPLAKGMQSKVCLKTKLKRGYLLTKTWKNHFTALEKFLQQLRVCKNVVFSTYTGGIWNTCNRTKKRFTNRT